MFGRKQRALDTARARIRQISERLDTEVRVADRLREIVADKDEQIAKLAVEANGLSQVGARLTGENHDLHTHNSDLVARLADAGRKIAQHEERIAHLDNELDILASYLVVEYDYEPSRSESTVGMAIRLLGESKARIAELTREARTAELARERDKLEGALNAARRSQPTKPTSK